MPRLTPSVALLLQAYAVSSSVIDVRADGSSIDRRDIFGQVAPRDVFKANPTCPTERAAFKEFQRANKGEALDNLLYGCTPPTLRGQLYPTFDDSNQNTIAGRGVDSNTVEETGKSSQSCNDITRAWGCVRGLDCRYVQTCSRRSLKELHGGGTIKLGDRETVPCAKGTVPREMHCKISTNPAAAAEVAFDRLIFELIMDDGQPASGKIRAEVGNGQSVSIFDGSLSKNRAIIPVNIPSLFGGETRFSLQQVMGNHVKLYYDPKSGGDDAFKIKSFTLFARLAGTNLVFQTMPLVDQKFDAGRGHTEIWSHQLDLEGWNTVAGVEKPISPFLCLSTETSEECSARLRYG
ncbi:hypothetical protein DCS_02520 [Drechmeria coniospora]|uniref:Uncharacterized protein n=1 Tax=Drechmeria coniospora TaxID=98403 RepID=A0A151GWA1_DRECN|nr:hypothetical protein DCS_02520 [Drechmeria coniospora]KYK61378.1 hypothetical protein DCS_02520 [Drechmeria coniospora]ODA81139.1 hypothetical protein RJ55_04103 [Drechmeria coniospora]